jgi:hypothetical protein
MKNQDQANNINNLNDSTIVKDPQALVEDLPISGEQEERVKGGSTVGDLKASNEADAKSIMAYSNSFSCIPSATHYQPPFLGGVKVAS